METKQKIYTVLNIIIIFLSLFLFFSIINGSVTTYIAIGSLSITYIILHYWEKRILKRKQAHIKMK